MLQENQNILNVAPLARTSRGHQRKHSDGRLHSKRGPSCGNESPNRKQKRSASPEDHFSFLKKDLLLSTVTTQKNMWKREKVGSTVRLGTHHVLPAFSLSPSLLQKLHAQIRSHGTASTTLFVPPRLSSIVQLNEIPPSQTLLPSIKVFTNSIKGSNTEKGIHSKPSIVNVVLPIFKDHIETIQQILSTSGPECEPFGSQVHQFHPLAYVQPLIQLSEPQFEEGQNSGLQLTYYALLPSLSFDYYQIRQLNYVATPFTENLLAAPGEFRHGILSISASKRIVVQDPQSPVMSDSPVVGIWVSNLPDQNKQSTPTGKTQALKHPFVWSTCLRFILSHGRNGEVLSPSSDQNTFLVLHFTGEKKSADFYEFKIVRNSSQDTNSRTTNSWVVVESLHHVSEEEMMNEGLNITFFKKNTEQHRYKVYSFARYIRRFFDARGESVRSTQELRRRKEQSAERRGESSRRTSSKRKERSKVRTGIDGRNERPGSARQVNRYEPKDLLLKYVVSSSQQLSLEGSVTSAVLSRNSTQPMRNEDFNTNILEVQ